MSAPILTLIALGLLGLALVAAPANGEVSSSTTAPSTQRTSRGCRNLGRFRRRAADSCMAIYQCNPRRLSGLYWVKSVVDGKDVYQQVYCSMGETKCGIRGGWMRVAHIDMTMAGATCPAPLNTITTPTPMCSRGNSAAAGCSSVIFETHNISYSRVCGSAVGYLYHAGHAFLKQANGIDGQYVDGLSITHGTQEKKHIWTYAAGLSENYNYPLWNCPCAVYPGPNPPAFVGNHYYCEASNTGVYDKVRQWYLDDKLWDGKGCDTGSNCCAASGMPKFCRTLPCETTDDIEVRWCADYGTGIEIVATEMLEIYVL